MAVNIAVKPGSTFTSIYISGHGLVLKEHTLAAFDGKDLKRLRAVGDDALAIMGKAPNTTFISPIRDGIITDPEIYSLMLKQFLTKICPSEAIFKPRYKAIVAIPMGLSVAEREMYEEVFSEAGVSYVTFVPAIVLSAIGADLPVGTGKGMLAINIGGGRSEIALLSCGGIINGCGVGLGGTIFDKALIDYVAGKYNVRISLIQAREIREEIGTLYDNDVAQMEIGGMDIRSNAPVYATVYALDVREVLLPYFKRICDLTKTILKSCPASIANDLMNGNIIISGGAANIPGLDELFMDELSLPVRISSRPAYTQIVGAGKLLSNDELVDQLIAGGSI